MTSSASLRHVPRPQRGVATLVTTLVILFILTLIVLSSANVALFEQKTSTNENRQHLADQAAEYALRLGGEYLKSNIVNLASAETNGWSRACDRTPRAKRFVAIPKRTSGLKWARW